MCEFTLGREADEHVFNQPAEAVVPSTLHPVAAPGITAQEDSPPLADEPPDLTAYPAAERQSTDNESAEAPPTMENLAHGLRREYQQRFRAAATNLRPLSQTQLEDAAAVLAAHLHDRWREEYIRANQSDGKPQDPPARWKSVRDDREWLAKMPNDPSLQAIYRQNPLSGEPEANIAGCTFDMLPALPWKIENTRAATTAIALVHGILESGAPIDDILLEQLSVVVHQAWLARNPHVNEPSDDSAIAAQRRIQQLNFHNPGFTEIERNKDRLHIVLAAELLSTWPN